MLSDDQRRTLASVLDEVIPPRADGRLPGAGALGLAATVEGVLRATPDLGSMIAEGLTSLDDAARARMGRAFVDVGAADKVALLNEQPFMLPLTLQVYVAYYQDPRVVTVLGLEARAPHPHGHAVAPSDLSLLDPVRGRPPLHRPC